MAAELSSEAEVSCDWSSSFSGSDHLEAYASAYRFRAWSYLGANEIASSVQARTESVDTGSVTGPPLHTDRSNRTMSSNDAVLWQADDVVVITAC